VIEGVEVIQNEHAREIIVVGNGTRDIPVFLPIILFLTWNDKVSITFNTTAAYQLRLADPNETHLLRSIVVVLDEDIYVDPEIVDIFPDQDEERWAAHRAQKLRPDLQHVIQGDTCKMFLPTDTFSGHLRREFSVELPRDPKTSDVFEYAKPVPNGRAQLDALIQEARFAKRKRKNMAALSNRGSNASSLSG
jgi:hypothetical protein